MTSASFPAHSGLFIDADAATSRWWKKRGTAVSIALHALAVVALWQLSRAPATPPAPPPPVELIRLQPQPPKELAPPPKPEPVKEKPLALAPPKPVARPLPTPKTVAASADKAETYTPPALPAPAPPIGPTEAVAPAPAPTLPAPPAPPAAKVIETEGIPTGYVDQVYTRINKNADYPREAKLRRQQGRVGYKLTLNPQGALLGFDIQTSGSEILDQAAREAIQRAAPFPKLPELGASTYLLAGFIVFKIN